MSDVLTDKIVKTRKPHQCWGCGSIYEKGSTMRYNTYAVDGTIDSAYWCETCDTILKNHYDEWDLQDGVSFGAIKENDKDFWRDMKYQTIQKNKLKREQEKKMNELELQAKEFAKLAHKHQKRKTSGEPYIKHPILVASILKKAGMPLPLVMAGYLHDVVEDTPFVMDDIERSFGEEVAHYVAFNTEDKDGTWEERKTHTIEALKEATLYEKSLVVADKYANLLELVKNHNKMGDSIWNCFKRGKNEQKWYFENVLISGMMNLEYETVPTFFIEYKELIETFFD